MLFRKIKELNDKAIEAEERALMHFRKLYAIENILKESDRTKEPYAETIIKIKELVYNYHTEN